MCGKAPRILLIIHQSSTKILNYPPVHPDLKRVEQITALGVTFNNTLSCGPHVNLITAKTAASLYALKTLRCHGLDGHALWGVTRATLVAQLLYARPFWRGFINAEETNRLQSILKKTICRSYLPLDFNSLDELLDSADHALFRVIVRNPHHVLHHYSLRAKELFTIYANLPMD